MASQHTWRYPVRISLLPPPPPPSEEVRTHGDSDLPLPPQTDYEKIETYAYHDLQTSPVLLEEEEEAEEIPPPPPEDIINPKVHYDQDPIEHNERKIFDPDFSDDDEQDESRNHQAQHYVATLKEKRHANLRTLPVFDPIEKTSTYLSSIPSLPLHNNPLPYQPPPIPAILTSASSGYPIPPPPIIPRTGPVSGVFPVTSHKPNAEINLTNNFSPESLSIPPPPPPPPEEDLQSPNAQETSKKKKKAISATLGRVKSSKNKDKSKEANPTKVDKYSTAASPKEIPKIQISYKVGDKVEVQREDGTWMKGKVTQVENKRVVVTFVMDGKKYQSEMFLS